MISVRALRVFARIRPPLERSEDKETIVLTDSSSAQRELRPTEAGSPTSRATATQSQPEGEREPDAPAMATVMVKPDPLIRAALGVGS